MVDLDTRLLRAFVAVAEELSFTRAAGRLFQVVGAVVAGVLVFWATATIVRVREVDDVRTALLTRFRR